MTDNPTADDASSAVEPFDEREMLDQHAADQQAKLFDPESVPRVPNGVEEGVTERGGTTLVDMMFDTTAAEVPSLRLEDDLRMEEPVIDGGPEHGEIDLGEDLEPDL
jgi:hypothetical protein